MIQVVVRCDICGKKIENTKHPNTLCWHMKNEVRRKDMCSECVEKLWKLSETIPHKYTQLKVIGHLDDE